MKKNYQKLIIKNDLDENNVQIDLKNIQRSIQIKAFHKIYDDEEVDEYYSNKMKNYQNFTEFHEIIFHIQE